MTSIYTYTAVALLTLAATPATAQIYSTQEAGEDYGDIYSSRGNRDIYTTADDRQGIYTTQDSGLIYDSEDKREGVYTSNETAPSASSSGDVPGSELKDSSDGLGAGSVYNGYLPE